MCMISSLPVFLPVLRALHGLCSFFFSCEFDTYLWHGALVMRMSLLICLSSFSICMFIILIPVYVFLNMYTQVPPLPYPYAFISIFICIVCVMFYTYTNVFFLSFVFFRNLIDTCVTVSIDVLIPLRIS